MDHKAEIKTKGGRITVGGLVDLYEAVGDPEVYAEKVNDLLGFKVTAAGKLYREGGRIDPTSYSFTDLCEAFCGRHFLRTLKERPFGMRGGRALVSAREDIGGGAMGPSQFANINAWTATVGGLLGASYLDGYNSPNFIGDKVTSLKTDIRAMEAKRVRYSPVTNSVTVLQPGQEIPAANIDSDYIKDTRPVRRGQAVELTREAVHFDWTDGLIASAKDLGYQFREDREERQLKAIFGVVNNYERKGTATNTYLTSGSYVNKVTNELVDETDLDLAFQTLANMEDPNTGRKIDVLADELFLISTAYKRGTASRLARATQHRFGDGASNTDAVYAGKDPQLEFQHEWTTRAVDLMTAAAPAGLGLSEAHAKERWVYGNTRKAFQTIEVWPFTMETHTMATDPALTRRGIFVSVCGEEFSEVTVLEPRYAVLCINGGA